MFEKTLTNERIFEEAIAVNGNIAIKNVEYNEHWLKT